jgi:hypothetical protein
MRLRAQRRTELDVQSIGLAMGQAHDRDAASLLDVQRFAVHFSRPMPQH